MVFSYSGITNYGKSILPSVSSGLGSMNILKDPPRSIHTRKIDKVGDTSSITNTIDEAGDRICEVILPFRRGANPFAKVSYNNDSNNAGQRVNGFGKPTRQAYLPYNLGGFNNDFRPPIRPPQDLFPLSRLPRMLTSQLTNPEFIDFTKKLVCVKPAEKTAGVKKEAKMMRLEIRPTSTFRLETPIKEDFILTSKYIQNPIKPQDEINSGIKSQLQKNNIFVNPQKNINENIIRVYANPNVGSSNFYKNSGQNIDTTNFINDKNYTSANTNVSSTAQLHSLEELAGNINQTKIRDLLQGEEHFANKNSFTRNGELTGHQNQMLEKNIPNYSTHTNKNIAYQQQNNSSTDYYLKQKLSTSHNSITSQQFIPTTERVNNEYYNPDTSIINRNRNVSNMMQERFTI